MTDLGPIGTAIIFAAIIVGLPLNSLAGAVKRHAKATAEIAAEIRAARRREP